jgi:hypothetical protein
VPTLCIIAPAGKKDLRGVNMLQTKKAVKVITETGLVICNMCGKHITPPKYHDTFLSVNKTWGYGSPFDGETHSFELCLECYDKLLGEFQVKI